MTATPVPDERVNHPAHYNQNPSGTECIDVVEHMPFNVGTAMKHLWRCGFKGSPADALTDLGKALWYTARELVKRGGALPRIPGMAEAPGPPPDPLAGMQFPILGDHLEQRFLVRLEWPITVGDRIESREHLMRALADNFRSHPIVTGEGDTFADLVDAIEVVAVDPPERSGLPRAPGDPPDPEDPEDDAPPVPFPDANPGELTILLVRSDELNRQPHIGFAAELMICEDPGARYDDLLRAGARDWTVRKASRGGTGPISAGEIWPQLMSYIASARWRRTRRKDTD
jgi:hypothetical protein